MKWLVSLILAVAMVTPAFAGEDPYISVVGKDSAANLFYVSPKYYQFMYDENAAPFYIPATFGNFPPINQYTRVGAAGQEMFRSQTINAVPEICDLTDARGLAGAKTPAGNAGFYEWYVRVPKKPDGEINIVIQCGVVKPNAVAAWGKKAVELCAAETGERIGVGNCVRQEVDPGTSPVIQSALPKITAVAYPGPYNVAFTPFKLTAFKNPSSYSLSFDATSAAIKNSDSSQVLDGSAGARILLKTCMDKTVVAKLPVTGQINALGDVENDLEPGDMIYVRMDVPRQNTVDIYCHAQSLKIMGLGESAE